MLQLQTSLQRVFHLPRFSGLLKFKLMVSALPPSLRRDVNLSGKAASYHLVLGKSFSTQLSQHQHKTTNKTTRVVMEDIGKR
jgi:hypothetical protein